MAINFFNSLAVGTDVLYVDTLNDRVGIGTTSPAEKLDVSGTIQSSANEGKIIINSTATNGKEYQLISIDTGNLGLFDGTAYRLWVAGSGNIGIGTTSPSTKLHLSDTSDSIIRIQRVGVQELQLNSDGTVTAASTDLKLVSTGNISFTASGSEKMRITSDSNPTLRLGVSGTGTSILEMKSASGGSSVIDVEQFLQIKTSGSERVRIDSSGNVSIGDSSARNARLLLNNAGSQGAPQLMLIDSGDSGKQSEIRFDSGNLIFDYWSGSSRSERMRIGPAGQIGIGGANYGTSGQVLTSNGSGSAPSWQNAGAGSSNWTLSGNDIYNNNSGNVGIGTTSPGAKLHTRDSSTSPGIIIESDGGNEQFVIKRYSNTNEQLILGFHSSDYGTIQAVEQGVSYRNLALNASGGNVGIGTTSPGAKLDVNGNAIFNGETYIRSTSNVGIRIQTTAQGITSSDGLRVGLNSVHAFVWQYETLPLSFATSGVERLRIDSLGNIGIGTTTPSQKLHVAGNVTADRYYGNGSTVYYVDPNDSTTAAVLAGGLEIGYGSAGEYRIEVGEGRTGNGYAYIDFVGDTTYSDYGLRLIRNNSGANTSSQLVHRGTGNLEFKTWDAGAMLFSTTNSERMRITSGGNVGIGTSSPSNGKLQIDSTGNQISIETGTLGDGRLHVGHFSNGTFIGTYGDDGGAADLIRFGTHSGDERMRITSSGNVGIGTTSPSSRLTIKSITTSGQGSNVLLDRGADRTSHQNYLVWESNSYTDEVYIGTPPNSSTATIGARWGDITFQTGSYVDRMRITSSGNVGVGTTSPGYKLAVSNGTHTLSVNPHAAGVDLHSTGNLAPHYQTDFTLYTGAIGSGTARLRVDSSGNVGVGTTSPINGGGNAKWITIDGVSGNSYSGGVIYSIGGSAKGYHYVQDNNIIHQGQSGVGHRFIANAGDAMTIVSSNKSINHIGNITSNAMQRPVARWGASGSSTGMIAIALPGDAGDYDMTTIEIEVYEYNSNAGSKIRVSAHTWSSGIGWYNYSISTDGVFNKSIYLGKSSSKYYILLGDTSSSWNYGSVIVRANTEAEFYNNVTPWGDAWSVTQVTTDPTSSKTSNLNTTSSRTSYTYGYSESGSSFRSPIFYDSNDTGYYVDPNGTSNIVSLTQAGYSQNAPIMGKWYSTDTYVYIAPTIYYYYIKVANLASNTSIGNLEYYCKKDSNYPGAVSGKVSVATYSASSMSVQHDQIGGNGSMTPQVILDNNRDVWLRMAGAAWNHEFRWRWTYNSGVTTYDGSTKQTTQPSNSDVIDAGESYRYSWNNVSSSTAYDNRNIVYSLSSSVDTRSPVFYDLNNTAYYIDPASNSNLYSLDIGIQSFDNNGNFDIGDTVGINSGTSMHCDGSNIKIESGAGFVYFSSGTSGNYFGGGIRVGGTGTANELDDYEEGTWTLSFAYAYQGGVTAYSVTSFGGYSWTGRYVKIGRLVHCTFYFSCTSFPWSVNTTSQVFMLDSSFPFALDSTTKAVNGSYYSFPGFSSSGTSNAEVTGVIFPQGYVSSYGAGFVADKGFYSNFEGPDTDAFNLGPGTPFTLKGSFQYYTAS